MDRQGPERAGLRGGGGGPTVSASGGGGEESVRTMPEVGGGDAARATLRAGGELNIQPWSRGDRALPARAMVQEDGNGPMRTRSRGRGGGPGLKGSGAGVGGPIRL